MIGSKRRASSLLATCFLVLLGLAASALALTDIYHGTEPDLSLEWWILRMTFLAVSLLVVQVFSLTVSYFRTSTREA